jgi:hypothetical protein
MRNSPLPGLFNKDKYKKDAKKPVPKPEGGFMHPPYKKPVGPTEGPHYVHGYKKPMHKMPDGTMMEGAKHKKSPIKKTYDFSKTKKDYTKSNPNSIGSKLAKAVTPKNTPMGIFTSMIPGKLANVASGVKKYLKG